MVLLLCFLLPFLLPSLLLVRWLDCSLQVCIETADVSVSRRRLGPSMKFSAENHRGRGTAVPAVACIALQVVGRMQTTCRAAAVAAVVSHLATLLFITVSATTITIFLTAIAIAITITITIAIAITITITIIIIIIIIISISVSVSVSVSISIRIRITNIISNITKFFAITSTSRRQRELDLVYLRALAVRPA